MKTRRSNRTKSFAVEKYDFEGSSDEDIVHKRDQKADADDDNFEAAAAAAAEESAAEDDIAFEREAVESDASVSDPEGVPDRFSRQRIKLIRPFNVRAVGVTGYLDVEPVAADGRIVRAYCGPYDRGLRGHPLVEMWYGRHQGGIKMAHGMLDRWMDWSVLPPRAKLDEQAQADRGVWSPNFFEREAYNAEHWYERVRDSMPQEASFLRLSDEEAQPYLFQRGRMPVLVGPHDSPREIMFDAGDAYTLSQSGIPLDQDDSDAKITAGWMLDAGGIVTSMDWARRENPNAPQLLAMCVIPHSDQEHYNFEQESVKPDFQRHGVVQLWEFEGQRAEDGFVRPSSQQPRLRRTICLEHGRARRVKWSPACGLLAVICGDGNVYVIEVGDGGTGVMVRYKLEQPVATFGLLEEERIEPTALTWINFNRLVVGYSDGSIALWSVRPSILLSRHPVHHNIVLDLVSGYPSMPYIIASYPVGGTVRLIDLRAPSFESTEVQALTVASQPNLLGYSDHLLGFFSTYPSAGVLNTQVGFMHHAQYPIARRVFTGQCFPSCLSVGRTHPYLLIGSVDGSLWALNPQVELFTTRREPSDRIRVFQHEHRPATFFPKDSPAGARGVSRVLQGFALERNVNPKTDFKPPVKKGKKVKKKEAEAVRADEEEDGAGPSDPTRAVVYEPLTRITAVEWNPNEEYGCWAAAAMGSGLVRVLDLGIDREGDDTT
ncbi:WD40-repeat-containing domain protein [Dactylonectria estremocensis]|uniref:WD40-repeat-containing domain protein n=1 Tax=Dactylonectria estremocensis TaxID=1079267 RepID=A0A9P9IT74_9HYPO|nr:WD40-repeat-containing domain protein [Dactylonectria estremocensis]